MREQLGNLKVQKNAGERAMQNLKNQLTASTSPAERKKLENRLAQETKNLANTMQNVERKQKLLNKQNQNIAQLKKEKLNANSQIATKNKEINQIKKNMAAVGSLSEEEKAKLRQNLEKAQEEKAGMKLESNMWHKRLLSEQEELRKAKIDRESFRHNATQKQIQLNELQGKKNAANAAAQAANAARKEANAAAQAAKKELNNKQAKFQEEEIKLKEQANRANKLRNQAQAERKKIRENKNAEITQIRKQLNNAGKLSEEEKAQLRKNLETAKTEKEKELANLKQKMEEQQELQKKITEKTQKLSNKRQATITTLKNNLQKATTNLTNAKQSLIKTEGWLRTKTNKLARAEGLITTQKASINESKTKLNERQKQVGKLYRNIKAKNAALAQKNTEAVEALAQKNREAAEALAQKNREAAEALAQKNADVQTMTQTIAAKNVQLQEALSRVRAANTRHETNRAAVAALEAESANLQQNLTAARELFEKTQKEQTTLRWKKAIGNTVSSKKTNKINKLKNNTKALGKEIENGKRTLNQTKETLAFGQRQLGTAEVAIQRLRKNKTNLTKNKTNLKTRLVGTKWKGIVGNRKLNQTRGQLQTAQSAATLNQQRAQAKINATKGQLRTTQGRLKGVQGKLNATKGQLRTTQGRLGGVQGQLRNVQKTLPGLKNSKYRERLHGLVDAKVNKSLVVRNRGLINFGRDRRRLKNEIMNPETQGKRLKEIESEIQSKIKAAKNNKFKIGNNTQTRPVQTREQVTFGENERPQVRHGGFAAGGDTQQINSRTPATNGKTPVQAVREPQVQRSKSSIGSRVVNRHRRQRQRQQ
jgi:hypothetical protein